MTSSQDILLLQSRVENELRNEMSYLFDEEGNYIPLKYKKYDENDKNNPNSDTNQWLLLDQYYEDSKKFRMLKYKVEALLETEQQQQQESSDKGKLEEFQEKTEFREKAYDLLLLFYKTSSITVVDKTKIPF